MAETPDKQTVLLNVNPNPCRRLLVPIVRCQIGDDVFMSGDGMLRSASVTMGQGERSSRCSFEIYDPDQKFAQKYFQASYEQGGISSIFPSSSGGLLGAASPVSAVGGAGTADGTMSPQRRAFLDCIAYAEGTSGTDGYNTMFTHKKFSNFKDHPRIVQGSGGLRSDAAGRYQFLSTTWDSAKKSLNLNDFSPASQDKAGLWLVQNRGALGDVDAGRFESAIGKCNQEWASLPGSPYGQPTKSMSELKNYYNQRLNVYQSAGQQQQAAQQSAVKPVTEEIPPVETADKGCQIIISFGYQLDQLAHFTFIHQGTRFSGVPQSTTSFEGQSVRWLLTRRTKNATYQNVTLRQLAEKVANSYGLKLEMKGDGPKFEFLDQTGLTDYQLLQRECDRIGYRLYDKGTKLILESRGEIPLGFALTFGINMDRFEVSDQAQSDSGAGLVTMATGDTNTAAQPVKNTATPTPETKTKIDPQTGQLDQKKKENKAASGLAGNSPAVSVTGAAKPAIAPKLAAPTVKEQEQKAKEQKKAGTETTTQPDPTNEVTAQQAASAAARVKGFPGSAAFTTTEAALLITPDMPFISDGMKADFLNRVWAIDTVTHDYSGGTLRTSIRFFSPMAPKNGGAGVAGSQIVAVSGNPGKMANPMPGTPRGTPFDPAGRIRGRPHTGIDMSSGGSANILATTDGVVVAAGSRGGYGYAIEIKHNGPWSGWSTLYAHLASMSVTTGQQVKRGQVIGREGSTGDSSGNHLHFEVWKNGAKVDPEVYICPPPTGVYGEGARTPIRSRC